MLNTPEETISGSPEISSLEKHRETINTAGGEVDIYWKIINYSKDDDKLTFRIENEQNDVKEEIIISPSKLDHTYFDNGTGAYKKTINLGKGEYDLEWFNGNDSDTIKIDYKITHNKKFYTSNECPYILVLTMFLFSFSLIGTIYINIH